MSATERWTFWFDGPEGTWGLGSGLLGYAIAAEELAQGCAATAMSFNMHEVISKFKKALKH